MHTPAPQNESSSTLPLQTACRHYFYKPYAAFFNAFHLRASADSRPG